MKPEQILRDAVRKNLEEGGDTTSTTLFEMLRDSREEISKLSIDLACTQKDLDRELRHYADCQLEISKLIVTQNQMGISEEEYVEISPEDLPF